MHVSHQGGEVIYNLFFILIKIKHKWQLAEATIAALSSIILHGFIPASFPFSFLKHQNSAL